MKVQYEALTPEPGIINTQCIFIASATVTHKPRLEWKNENSQGPYFNGSCLKFKEEILALLNTSAVETYLRGSQAWDFRHSEASAYFGLSVMKWKRWIIHFREFISSIKIRKQQVLKNSTTNKNKAIIQSDIPDPQALKDPLGHHPVTILILLFLTSCIIG